MTTEEKIDYTVILLTHVAVILRNVTIEFHGQFFARFSYVQGWQAD